MRRHLADIFQILPVDTPPGNALISFLELNVAENRPDLRADETLLIEPRACLCFLGLDDGIAQRHFDQCFGLQQVFAAQQEGIDCIGGGLGGFPVLRLFLLEQPDFAILDRLGIFTDFGKRLDHHRLRFDRCPIPPLRPFRIAPVHPHFLTRLGSFLDRFQNPLRLYLSLPCGITPAPPGLETGDLRVSASISWLGR